MESVVIFAGTLSRKEMKCIVAKNVILTSASIVAKAIIEYQGK